MRNLGGVGVATDRQTDFALLVYRWYQHEVFILIIIFYYPCFFLPVKYLHITLRVLKNSQNHVDSDTRYLNIEFLPCKDNSIPKGRLDFFSHKHFFRDEIEFVIWVLVFVWTKIVAKMRCFVLKSHFFIDTSSYLLSLIFNSLFSCNALSKSVLQMNHKIHF